jgi:hypothetical protein
VPVCPDAEADYPGPLTGMLAGRATRQLGRLPACNFFLSFLAGRVMVRHSSSSSVR